MKRVCLFRIGLFVVVSVFCLCTAGFADMIYVSSGGGGTGKIYKYDTDGNRSTFASDLYSPHGTAVDDSGFLYALLASPAGASIAKYDMTGNHTTFASNLENSIKFLAVDQDNNLFAGNYKNPDGTILKFSPDGNASIFASDLLYPNGLAFDGDGYLYAVQEYGGISRFDSNGTILETLTTLINHPCGIAFDDAGNVYWSNDLAGTIIKYDFSGNYTEFASGLNSPRGLAFDSSGNLYVANYGSANILKYDPSGNESVFASGVSADYITVQIPEPASFVLVGLGGLALWRKIPR